MEPLVRRYFEWTTSTLALRTKRPGPCEPLRTVEKVRIMRAFYRMQIMCNLFGVPNTEDDIGFTSAFDGLEILGLFLSFFEPWEIEEVNCVYAFVYSQYSLVFDHVVRALNEEHSGRNPRTIVFRSVSLAHISSYGKSLVPLQSCELTTFITVSRLNIIQGTISRGLDVLQEVLLINNMDQLISNMKDIMTWTPGSFLEHETLGMSSQYQRRRRWPSSRDEMESRREAFPFRGDVEVDLDGSYPPLSWTLIWNGTYSNTYGSYLPDQCREWGWVFWAAERFDDTLKELLAEEFATIW